MLQERSAGQRLRELKATHGNSSNSYSRNWNLLEANTAWQARASALTSMSWPASPASFADGFRLALVRSRYDRRAWRSLSVGWAPTINWYIRSILASTGCDEFSARMRLAVASAAAMTIESFSINRPWVGTVVFGRSP